MVGHGFVDLDRRVKLFIKKPQLLKRKIRFPTLDSAFDLKKKGYGKEGWTVHSASVTGSTQPCADRAREAE